MDRITERTRELYNRFQYGHLSYGRKREKFDPLLMGFLSMIAPADTLFDIGCGSGFWMETYLRCGVSKPLITAVDLCPANVEDLKRRGFNALCDDVLDLSLEDNVADFTICNGVIHHTVDPFRAFSELVRITKPGGYLYLSVYNQWNPYFYLVHRAAYPIRSWYWNWDRRIADVVYPLWKIVLQVLSLLLLRELLDDNTAKTVFMDQVMTPRAHLFSKTRLKRYAARCGCQVQALEYIKHRLMLGAIMKMEPRKGLMREG
jgi:SAM-dependent methyltransferase